VNWNIPQSEHSELKLFSRYKLQAHQVQSSLDCVANPSLPSSSTDSSREFTYHNAINCQRLPKNSDIMVLPWQPTSESRWPLLNAHSLRSRSQLSTISHSSHPIPAICLYVGTHHSSYTSRVEVPRPSMQRLFPVYVHTDTHMKISMWVGISSSIYTATGIRKEGRTSSVHVYALLLVESYSLPKISRTFVHDGPLAVAQRDHEHTAGAVQ